jgi:uncharacterized membrane protein YhaH (DUF805 family)
MSILNGRMRRRSYGLWLMAYLVAWTTIMTVGVVQMALRAAPNATRIDFSQMYQPRWAFILALTVLIGAFTIAVMRRVHDCDWPSYLGYGFGVIAVFGACFQLFMFDTFIIDDSRARAATGLPFSFDMTQLVLFQLNGLASMGCLVLMLVLVFVRGTVGPNRHDADPRH